MSDWHYFTAYNVIVTRYQLELYELAHCVHAAICDIHCRGTLRSDWFSCRVTVKPLYITLGYKVLAIIQCTEVAFVTVVMYTNCSFWDLVLAAVGLSSGVAINHC